MHNVKSPHNIFFANCKQQGVFHFYQIQALEHTLHLHQPKFIPRPAACYLVNHGEDIQPQNWG